ncbi:MAG: ribonuclease P protein component [bacterium]|nr:ribonuclease P protein component [bacterium]
MKIHRLQSMKDFKTLFRFGRYRESLLFKMVIHPNSLSFTRIAFIAPKTVDKRAVIRNRLRRQAREWIRVHVPLPSRPLDIALTFKKSAAGAERNVFYEDIASLFK